MPIEEAGGYCDYCQRPVLGRRQGVNHILYAILTIFSCGIWGLVWLIQSLAGAGDYACPNCGGHVREGAHGPLPPVDPNASVAPTPQNTAIKRALGVVLGVIALTAAIGTVSWMNSEKRLTQRIPTTTTTTPPAIMTEAARLSLLTDASNLREERVNAFRRALAQQSRECGAIASMKMRRAGTWTVRCTPAKTYVLEYNGHGDLVGLSLAEP